MGNLEEKSGEIIKGNLINGSRILSELNRLYTSFTLIFYHERIVPFYRLFC
jgi:hypothetical protein